jgi:electron transfer flavoprotein beta subunit
LKILVLIKNVLDTRTSPECVEETGRIIEDWRLPILNPDDLSAVGRALQIKTDRLDAHITAIHLGPPSGDRFIREALALGCDEGLRIWDEALENLHTAGKALVFERVSKILGFDLLLTGTRSLDTAGAQLGILLACALDVPCVTRVLKVETTEEDTLTVTKKLDLGWREQLESAFPVVMTVKADEETLPYSSFPDFVRAQDTAVPCMSLPDIGISSEAVRQAESRLAFGPLRLPEPGLQFVQPPDSSLPAFDRRRQLGEGSLQKRQGRVVRGSGDEVAEELFRTLRREGWLDHLGKATDTK